MTNLNNFSYEECFKLSQFWNRAITLLQLSDAGRFNMSMTGLPGLPLSRLNNTEVEEWLLSVLSM
jgi:hypothetical protein